MRKPAIHKSFINAFRGLFFILKNERNFQIEIIGLLINLTLIYYLKLTTIDSIIIILISFFVLVTEILNTCVEKICDFIHPEFDQRIGIIKDMAAGAVILSVISAIITGFLVYQKYLF